MSCEYCGRGGIEIADGDGMRLSVDGERRELLAEVVVAVMRKRVYEYERIPIRYCPMCGGKLGEREAPKPTGKCPFPYPDPISKMRPMPPILL